MLLKTKNLKFKMFITFILNTCFVFQWDLCMLPCHRKPPLSNELQGQLLRALLQNSPRQHLTQLLVWRLAAKTFNNAVKNKTNSFLDYSKFRISIDSTLFNIIFIMIAYIFSSSWFDLQYRLWIRALQNEKNITTFMRKIWNFELVSCRS